MWSVLQWGLYKLLYLYRLSIEAGVGNLSDILYLTELAPVGQNLSRNQGANMVTTTEKHLLFALATVQNS